MLSGDSGQVLSDPIDPIVASMVTHKSCMHDTMRFRTRLYNAPEMETAGRLYDEAGSSRPLHRVHSGMESLSCARRIIAVTGGFSRRRSYRAYILTEGLDKRIYNAMMNARESRLGLFRFPKRQGHTRLDSEIFEKRTTRRWTKIASALFMQRLCNMCHVVPSWSP